MSELTTYTKKRIEKDTGLSYEQLKMLSIEEIDAHVEKRVGKKLRPVNRLRSYVSRGSALLFLNRLISREEINKKFSHIK